MAPAPTKLHGYLNLLKPPNVTSHDIVAAVRRLSGQRHVGHTGTLDPGAVGVLPVAFGRAAPTVSSPIWSRKVYWADVTFGSRTTTDDAEGTEIEGGSYTGLALDRVTRELAHFVGESFQTPPAVSAVHVNGERAYARARRGETADQLAARRVWIDAIELVGWAPPRMSILVSCRSGTYVRALARDIGIAVDCPAHLGALIRLRVGPFSVWNAFDLHELDAIASHDQWSAALVPTDAVCGYAWALILADERAREIGRAHV